MNTSVDHVLLTRFNLPSAGVERSFREQDGWLTHRISLFDRYCVPSVQSQTNRNFRWIIYFDPLSPEWLKDRIAEYGEVFTPVYRASVSRDELLADIRSVVAGDGGALVTTNLDNDDALASDFVERIQSVPPQPQPTAVFITTGLIKDARGTYWRVDRDNAFCTVVAPWRSPVTCWADWHVLLRRRMPVIELDGAPGWLQVVHGENVSNRVRGRLVPSSRWKPLFPGALDDVPPPTPIELLKDRLIVGPTRVGAETARGAAKRLALRLLGKDGVDRLKVRMAGGQK